jgi:predicted DNA-binding transcriptional regulator AlpA
MKKTIININDLINAAPGPVVSYEEAARLTGGLISKKSLQNFASRGELPERIRAGGKVGFRTRDFAEWFVSRLSVV